MKAVIGLGTNLGDRYYNIMKSIEALSLVPGIKLTRQASVYETEPWGYTEQAAFFNTVAEVETELSPEMLLGACLGVEAGMGREREITYGPRVIDLDLLVYEGYENNDKHITVPHPRMGERDFVLVPLKELYPDMNILGFSYGKEFEKYGKNSSAKKVEKI